jgi:hypothetical protein
LPILGELVDDSHAAGGGNNADQIVFRHLFVDEASERLPGSIQTVQG